MVINNSPFGYVGNAASSSSAVNPVVQAQAQAAQQEEEITDNRPEYLKRFGNRPLTSKEYKSLSPSQRDKVPFNLTPYGQRRGRKQESEFKTSQLYPDSYASSRDTSSVPQPPAPQAQQQSVFGSQTAAQKAYNGVFGQTSELNGILSGIQQQRQASATAQATQPNIAEKIIKRNEQVMFRGQQNGTKNNVQRPFSNAQSSGSERMGAGFGSSNLDSNIPSGINSPNIFTVERQPSPQETITGTGSNSFINNLSSPKLTSGEINRRQYGDFLKRDTGLEFTAERKITEAQSSKNPFVQVGGTVVYTVGLTGIQAAKAIGSAGKSLIAGNPVPSLELLNPLNPVEAARQTVDSGVSFFSNPNKQSSLDFTSSLTRRTTEFGLAEAGGLAFRTTKPFIKGDVQGFKASANTFADTSIARNAEVFNRQAVKGDVPFQIRDPSAPTRAAALKNVGYQYNVQTDLFGNAMLRQSTQKGFLAKEGVNLKENVGIVKNTGDTVKIIVDGREIPLNIKQEFAQYREGTISRTGQTRLMQDRINNFPRGRTQSPNVMQSQSAVQQINPQYEIVDFVNPEKNFPKGRPSTQTQLVPNNVPTSRGTTRNSIKEIYGRKDFIKKPTAEAVPEPAPTEFFAELETVSESPLQNIQLTSGRSSNLIIEENFASPTINQKTVMGLNDAFKASRGEGLLGSFASTFNTNDEVSLIPDVTSPQLPETDSGLGTLPDLDTSLGQLPETGLIQTPSNDSSTGTLPDVSLGTGQIPGTITETMPVQDSVLSNVQQTQSLLGQTTTQATRRSYSPPGAPPEGFNLFKPTAVREKAKKSLRVKVQARRRGRFETLGIVSDISEASDLLSSNLKNTAAASGRLVDAITNKPLDVETKGALQGFIKSTREKGVIIQPRSQRISSRGEVEQISLVGQRMSRISAMAKPSSIFDGKKKKRGIF